MIDFEIICICPKLFIAAHVRPIHANNRLRGPLEQILTGTPKAWKLNDCE